MGYPAEMAARAAAETLIAMQIAFVRNARAVTQLSYQRHVTVVFSSRDKKIGTVDRFYKQFQGETNE